MAISDGKCRHCGVPVWFIDTAQGKKMPVDRQPVEYGGNCVIDAGMVRVVKKDEPLPADTKRFKAHFATCRVLKRAQSVEKKRKAKAAKRPKVDVQPTLFGGSE